MDKERGITLVRQLETTWFEGKRQTMTSFEMIKYHGKEYPTNIPLRIEEIAAHFDITEIRGKLNRSLHTEYSYGKRKFNSALIAKYPELLAAQKDGVPQLWKNESWALQFADFIIELVGNESAPSVIEIHPPFSDYTDLAGFVKCYSEFEILIKEHFPGVEILIENRCGSVYRGGRFVISKVKDIAVLADAIAHAGLQLKVAYDVPQIYTAHNARTEDKYISLLDETRPFRGFIGGVHLWGKSISSTGRKIAHCGDLNSYFGDQDIKNHFLQAFKDCFDDGVIRKMVLEVNSSNEDLQSIVTDLCGAGICFV